MNSNTETVLLERLVQRQDAEAFSAICQSYAGMVHSTCLRVTRDHHRAAEATQETFFALLRDAGKVTGSLAGWLHRVATRRAIDFVRSDVARRERELAYTHEVTTAGSDTWAEISPLVDESLNDLPEDLRQILVRHYLHGESMTDIALTDAVSQPTISRRVEKALQELRTRLRAKGVSVALTGLASLLATATEAAPAAVVRELGKMTLASSALPERAGSPHASKHMGFRIVATSAVVSLVIVLGLGIVAFSGLWQENARPEQILLSASRSEDFAASSETLRAADGLAAATVAMSPVATASPGLQTNGAAEATRRLPGHSVILTRNRDGTLTMTERPRPDIAGNNASDASGAAPLFGGVTAANNELPVLSAENAGGESTAQLSPVHETICRFVQSLETGDAVLRRSCFEAGSTALQILEAALRNPTDPEQEGLKQRFGSIGLPIEIVEVTSLSDGVQVKWMAKVTKPFEREQGGAKQLWSTGDKFEMEARLKQIGDGWKITTL